MAEERPVGRVIHNDTQSEEEAEEEDIQIAKRQRLMERRRAYYDITMQLVAEGETWALDFIQTEPRSTINILEENNYIRRHPGARNEAGRLEPLIPKWVELSKQYDHTICGRIKYECAVVREMNKWFCAVHWNNQDAKIMVKHKNNDGLYELVQKSYAALVAIFEPYKVMSFNSDILLKFIHSMPREEGSHELISTTVDKHDMPQPVNLLLVPKNLFVLWFNHGFHLKYNQVVFNPRPAYFVRAAADDDLNIWSGMAITRDEVLNFTNWNLIIPILNHFRYTWAEDETQYKHLLGWFANILQLP